MPEPTQPILYAVTAALPDPRLRDDYIAWLTGGHVQEVIAAGASEARVVVLDPDPNPAAEAGENATFRVESVYIFPTRQALETYFRDHAPRLRAEGVARFASRGVTFQRRIGRVAGLFSSVNISHSHGASA
ncbi:MAG: DUF4286 family protein [Planctomycetota bacterium]|nr:DUF4286 family protein [Planctomycetota bacterium]